MGQVPFISFFIHKKIVLNVSSKNSRSIMCMAYFQLVEKQQFDITEVETSGSSMKVPFNKIISILHSFYVTKSRMYFFAIK